MTLNMKKKQMYRNVIHARYLINKTNEHNVARSATQNFMQANKETKKPTGNKTSHSNEYNLHDMCM